MNYVFQQDDYQFSYFFITPCGHKISIIGEGIGLRKSTGAKVKIKRPRHLIPDFKFAQLSSETLKPIPNEYKESIIKFLTSDEFLKDFFDFIFNEDTLRNRMVKKVPDSLWHRFSKLAREEKLMQVELLDKLINHYQDGKNYEK